MMRIGGTNRSSDIVICNRTVYLSGVVPLKPHYMYEQAKEVLERINKLLECAGSSKRDILNMTIYLRDGVSYNKMNLALDEWIPKDCAPACTIIGNVCFPNRMWRLQISVIAYIPFVTNSSESSLKDSVNYVV